MVFDFIKMFFSLQNILLWLATYKYWVIFPISVFEGPIVAVLSGFLSAHGKINFVTAYFILVLGDVVGDLLYYFLGRWGRNTSIALGWRKITGASNARILKLEKYFKKHAGKTLLISKVTQGIGSVFLFAAGVAKVPIGKFVFFNLVGTLPKSFLLVLIGYYFGESYKQINNYLSYTAEVTVGITILLIVSYYLAVRFMKNMEKE